MNLTIEELRQLVREAEDAYWNEPDDAILGEGTRQAFVARFIYDHFHALAREVDAVIPEAAGYGAGV